MPWTWEHSIEMNNYVHIFSTAFHGQFMYNWHGKYEIQLTIIYLEPVCIMTPMIVKDEYPLNIAYFSSFPAGYIQCLVN